MSNARPTAHYTLPTLAGGTLLSLAAVNAYQSAMAHFAGRGATFVTLQRTFVNGKINVPCGVVSKGFAHSFILDRRSIAVPAMVAPGQDSLSIMFQVRLKELKYVSAINAYVGSSIKIELVHGGDAFTIQEIGWANLLNLSQFPNNIGTFFSNHKIGGLFRFSPVHSNELWIRITYDSTDGRDDLLGTDHDGNISNSDFWQGLGYFQASIYRDCEPC